jgi:hypothetical protein
MSEPKLVEVSATRSFGGKVQIVKYDIDSSYFVSESRRYSIPDDWSEEQALKFIEEKDLEVRNRVEQKAQDEFDSLFDQSYLK